MEKILVQKEDELKKSETESETNSVFDLFKSASKNIELDERKKEDVILKIKTEY